MAEDLEWAYPHEDGNPDMSSRRWREGREMSLQAEVAVTHRLSAVSSPPLGHGRGLPRGSRPWVPADTVLLGTSQAFGCYPCVAGQGRVMAMAMMAMASLRQKRLLAELGGDGTGLWLLRGPGCEGHGLVSPGWPGGWEGRANHCPGSCGRWCHAPQLPARHLPPPSPPAPPPVRALNRELVLPAFRPLN